MIVTISQENKQKFEAKLEKLNRFAAKMGLPLFTFTVEKTLVDTEDGKVQRLKYEIVGEVPTINGWSVVARLEHGENNLVFAHQELPEEFRTRKVCDHCNTIRPRNVTYVLKQGDKYIQVGGSCLAYYLPKDFEDFATFYKSLGESENIGRHEQLGAEVLFFLQVAHAAIKKYGYKKTSDIYSTADLVMKYIMDWKKRDEFGITLTEDDMVKAYETVNWLYEQPNTDYFYNCRTICANNFVTYKVAGLLASSAYLSAKATEPKKANIFLGEVGGRYNLELTVVSRQYLDTAYGTTLIRFVDQSGNKYSWFASASYMGVGQTYKVKATVKAHDVKYDCTVITRVKEC